MKVALLLCGYVRDIEKSYENIYDTFLRKYDCDIYISTWNTLGNKTKKKIYGDKNTDWINNNIKLNSEKLIEKFKPKQYEIENINNFSELYNDEFINNFLKKNNYTSFSRCKNSVLGQFYKIKKVWSLFEKTKTREYDIIIKSRFDFKFLKNDINLDILDNNSIYFSSKIYQGVADFFFISKHYENIKKLFNIFDWIVNNSDIQNQSYILKSQGRTGPVPELFIYGFLNSMNINIKTFNSVMDYKFKF